MTSRTRLGLVEDQSLVAEDLTSLLNGLDYEVVFRAKTGKECLESVDEKTVDLVVMDINLDGDLDGIEGIVNNVKLFSSQDQPAGNRERFDPLPVVRDALGTFDRNRGTLLEVRIGKNQTGREIMADPTEVSQVVTNLVSNALDAVEDTDDPEVICEARFDGDHFVFQVQDNGSGMPEDVREKIFDPFYTIKSTGEGTGLGLSIVQGIVNRAGGEITVNSTLGVGTRFEVLIPAYREE